MAGGGVSAFVEGVRELPRHWCGGRTGWKEAVTRPDPSPAPRPTASATWERNGVLTSLRAEWSCWGSVCCGLSGWMPLSVSASPKRQGLCLLLWLLSRVGKMAQEQLCRYVTILGQKPMDGRTQGHWQVLLLSLAVAPTWTAGPRSSTSASSLASPWALGLGHLVRGPDSQTAVWAAGTPGALSRPSCMQFPEVCFLLSSKTSRGPAFAYLHSTVGAALPNSQG